MTPILYNSTETNFNHNGLGLLVGATSCNVTENRNGTYELEASILVGSNLYDELKGKMIIKAKANDRFDDQLFRIYYISKPLNDKITVKAEHISYRLNDNFIESLSYTGGVNATLELMDAAATFPSGFNFYSDLTNSYAFSFTRINFQSAIVGSEGSILDTVGGADIVRDNFDYKVLANGGQSNNVLLAYKRNMTGFKCEENQTDLVTKIYPYVIYTDDNSNEITVTLTEKYIESPLINNYPNPIILAVDFTSYFDTNTETVDEAALRTKASTYFTDTECDIPKLTYNIELISLSNTEEYKDFAFNESIGLNDKLIVRHETYELDTTIKVVKTVYDSLDEKYITIGLGQPKSNLTDTFNNLTQSISKVVSESTKDKVSTSFLNNVISQLSNAITGNDGGFVRLNPPTNPSEILIMDNEDINLAQTVWRWNNSGLGVSKTGFNGEYVGLAEDGKLVVNEATANKINANLIKAGTLISTNNLSWINMDDGTFNFGNVLTWDGEAFTINYANTSIATALSNKADSSVVNTLAETVADKADTSTVNSLASTVSNKAETSTVNSLTTTVGNKLNTSDLPTAIGNNQVAVQTAINKVSNYFQVTNDGATFGNVASGDYTTVNSDGLKHHIGATNSDYKYYTYADVVNFDMTGVTSKDITVTFPTDVQIMLNGKIPAFTASVRSAWAISDDCIQSFSAYTTNITSTSITLHVYLVTKKISGATSSKNGSVSVLYTLIA